jgi:hypothetical protein
VVQKQHAHAGQPECVDDEGLEAPLQCRLGLEVFDVHTYAERVWAA